MSFYGASMRKKNLLVASVISFLLISHTIDAASSLSLFPAGYASIRRITRIASHFSLYQAKPAVRYYTNNSSKKLEDDLAEVNHTRREAVFNAAKFALELKAKGVYFPEKVHLRHVGPRDGMQKFVDLPVPPHERGYLLQDIAQLEFSDVEPISWGLKDNLSQGGYFEFLRDHKERANRYTFLTMRRKHFDDFITACQSLSLLNTQNVPSVAVVIGMDDEFNRNNFFSKKSKTSNPTEKILSEIREIHQIARDTKVPVRTYLSTVFNEDGIWDLPKVLEYTQEFMRTSVSVHPSDTLGIARPEYIRELMSSYKNNGLDISKVSLHLHRTKEKGGELKNMIEFLRNGGTRIDVGYDDETLGGCHKSGYDPSANLSDKEALVILRSLGIDAGISLSSVAAANELQRQYMARWMRARDLLRSAQNRETIDFPGSQVVS